MDKFRYTNVGLCYGHNRKPKICIEETSMLLTIGVHSKLHFRVKKGQIPVQAANVVGKTISLVNEKFYRKRNIAES